MVLDAAEATIPISKPSSKLRVVPWWSPECARAVAKRRRALRIYQKHITSETRLAYQVASRHCRAVLLRAKKSTWQDFVSNFNRFTPLAKIWQFLKAFSHKKDPICAFPQLLKDGVMVSCPDDVVATFADYFASISSNDIFTTLQKRRFSSLVSSCEFMLDSTQQYNSKFTPEELNSAILSSGHTSVGPDGVHYDFFRNISLSSKSKLLRCFNSAWTSGKYPEDWLSSYIIPILKKGKPKTDISSYRPITLTSCACKLFEKMVNVRLRFYLEHNNLLDPHQSGFRKGRSTADNVFRLTDSIQRGFAKKSQTVAVFLDLSKAYDRVNIDAMLHKIYAIGIRGNMSVFLKFFLQPRTFQVRCRTYLSSPHVKQHGLPQGSVIAPTLFLIVINSIATSISQPPSQVSHSVFADDVALWSTDRSVDRAASNVQEALNNVADWCLTWGFEISAPKSASVVFTKHSTSVPRLGKPLKVDDDDIPEKNSHTFLGIILDCRLRFHTHALHIKSKATKRLNILRAVSHTTWGGDRVTLLRVYTSLIRSVLEYNSFILTYLATSNQRKLDTVQNSALRLISGAFSTSPVAALHADINIPRLEHRAHLALFRYYFRTQSTRNHPSYDCFGMDPKDLRSRSYRSTPIAAVQIQRFLQRYDINLNFRIAACPPLSAFWIPSSPHVAYLFSESKVEMTSVEIQSRFNEFRAANSSASFFFTDGSKTENAVGAAFYGESQKSFRLHSDASIFSAELFAILQALRYIKRRKIMSSVICSDSKSALQAIQNVISVTNNMVFRIQRIVDSISSASQKVSFLWIPGHSGLDGNSKADELAKAACDLEVITPIALSPQEASQIVFKCISRFSQDQWDNETKGRHTYKIKPLLHKWASSNCDSRLKEVVLARLRIGHTRLTHKYLLDRSTPPLCPQCDVFLSIEHIILDCPRFSLQRKALKDFTVSLNLPFSVPLLLGDGQPDILKKLFTFLMETNIFYSI